MPLLATGALNKSYMNMYTVLMYIQSCILYIHVHVHVHEQSLQEMLRKVTTTQQKSKATQHNSPESYFSKKNWLSQVALKPTNIHVHVRMTKEYFKCTPDISSH